MKIASLLLVSLVSLFWPGELRAQTEENAPQLQLDLGVNSVFGFWSMVCDSHVDVVACPSMVFMPELKVGGQFRKGRWAIGGVGSLGILRNSDIVGSFMWRAALDGRYYASIGRVSEFWYAVELGMAGAHANNRILSPCCGPGAEPEKQLGPEIGAGLGVDFLIGTHFALGLSARALWLIFLGPSETTATSMLKLDKTIWILAGVHGRFSFGL